MGAIVVRFIKSAGLVSDLIAGATDSLFDHAEFGTPEGTWIGAHDDGGVQERAANYCNPRREYVYSIPCTDEQEASLLAWARGKIGTPYNFEDIAGLLFHSWKLNNPKADICSQFCCVGLLQILGAARVFNVLEARTFLITPEILHLSPIFVGNRTKAVG